ncbi:Protein unc-93 A [Bulinus truncatus]|nr:Protein unc-93 A [Bulinus truncatus]
MSSPTTYSWQNGDASEGAPQHVPKESLQTIAENEVACFEAVGNGHHKFPKITDNILNVDESFLYSSQPSLPDMEAHHYGGQKRAPTMKNIHERASFLNLTSEPRIGRVIQKALLYIRDDAAFGSTAGLNIAVTDKVTTSDFEPLKADSGLDTIASLRYAKNLLVVSLSVTLMFIAMGSVRNLQSSMNHEAGVGITSMAVGFFGYMLGSVFSPSLVQIFLPRSCLIAGLIPQFMYIAANLYPVMWLMVIASLAQGVGMAIAWNAMSTYIILLAKGRALQKEEKFSSVSSRYFGFFGLFFQSYFVIGNLISSLVLSSGGPLTVNGNTSNIEHKASFSDIKNNTLINTLRLSANGSTQADAKVGHLHLCGASFWQHYDLGGASYEVEETTKLLLLGIYMGCVLVAVVIAACFLERLNPKLFESSLTAREKVMHQLLSLKKFCTNRSFILLFPLLMYSFMEVGFLTGEVTKAYVTCALGIHMVGYAMICFGVCGCFSSYLSGFLNKFISFRPLLITAALLNIAVLVHMTIWEPRPGDLLPFFFDFGLWGISDGIWVSQVNSLLSVIFPNNYEEAFAGLRIAQGLGVAVIFGYSNFLSMLSKIYITGAVCLTSVSAYIVMDVMRDRGVKKRFALMRETSI